MNIGLWVLQAFLAFLNLSGGAFKLIAPAALVRQFPSVPELGWRGLGAVEIVGAVLLILPGTGLLDVTWTGYAAVLLMFEASALSLLYARHSLAVAAANPLMFSLPMAVVATVIALGRLWGGA